MTGLLMGAVACGALVPTGATAQSGPTTYAYYGLDIGPNAETAYAGALVALNGDFNRSGFVFRALGLYSTYDYSAAIGDVDGTLRQLDAMIGYHLITSNWWSVLAYVGVEHQNHRLSPHDPFNPVVGSETGLKVAADITPHLSPDWYVNLMASYSTAFDSYWSRLRVGHNFGKLTIGPEVQFNGNEVFDERRIGAFIDFRLGEPGLRATLSAGFQFSDRDGIFDGKDGAYAGVNIGWGF